VVERLDPGSWLIATVLAGAALFFGVLAGIEPPLAIAGALAVALMLLAISNLIAGLVGFILLSFMEFVPAATGPTLSLSKLAGAVLAVAWLARVANGEYKRLFPSVHPGITVLLIAFLAWNGISVLWAEELPRVVTSVSSFLLAFALFPIVYSAVRTERDLRWLILAFVAGATFTAIYGVLSQPSAAAFATSPAAASGLNRLAGTIGDPNELAAMLVAGVALSSAIVFNRNVNGTVRLAVGFADLLMLAGVFLTLSRGGLVSLSAVLLVAIFIARPRVYAIVGGAAVVGVVAILFFGVASQEARDRVTSNDGGSGRTDIWKVGWRMVEDKPITGVGASNFQNTAIHYLLIAPGAIQQDEFLVDVPSVAHNAYLQVLAETGVIGLALFLATIVACIGVALRAQRQYRARSDPEGELLATAVVLGIAALLSAYFFLSEEHSKSLWLLLSFCPVLFGLATRRAKGDGEPAH
jgi:O-antigen ligase